MPIRLRFHKERAASELSPPVAPKTKPNPKLVRVRDATRRGSVQYGRVLCSSVRLTVALN
jgi:hypothetical protein